MANKLLFLLTFCLSFLCSEIAVSATNRKPLCERTPRIIIGKGLTWSRKDDKIFAMASRGCRRRYTNSPCVAVFKKYGQSDYSVICGASKERRGES